MLKLILELIQAILLLRSQLEKASSMHCCEAAPLVQNGSYERRIRTSLGDFKMKLHRVKCTKCGKTFSPLLRFLHLERYQTKSNELEKLVIETVAENTYRRGMKALKRDINGDVSFQTAHGWVLRTECDEIQIDEHVVGTDPLQLFADGTGYKGPGEKGSASKGDLKICFGVDQEGGVISLGAWAGKSWAEISKQWEESKVTLPDKSILVCDGELAIADAFAEYVDEQQRCHWHVVRDLYHAIYQDGGKTTDAKPIQSTLAGILAIELPEEDFEQVSEQQKDEIKERMENAEKAVDTLITYFEAKNYLTAATYCRNAKNSLFGYIRRWLRFGLVSPRASSMVERVMRELGRRIKKIAYGWKEKGVEKIARIILKRFSCEEDWDKYWDERMNHIGKVVIRLQAINGTSPELA